LSLEQLSELTNIKQAMLSRMERQIFIPSINQFEALAKILEFEIFDMFIEAPKRASFKDIALQGLSQSEKEGFEKLISMMLVLKHQILLRHKFKQFQ
jgi:transcriptional regulator with XRE-family HTH domain